jgi:hypothetical protein
VGYDLDPAYVDIARRRVDDEIAAHAERVGASTPSGPAARIRGADAAGDATSEPDPAGIDVEALAEGKGARAVAIDALTSAGFTVVQHDRRIRGTGVTVDLVATDAAGGTWWFEVAGPYAAHRGGMTRTEVVWRSLGRAAALRAARGDIPFVVLTTERPRRPGDADTALRAAGPSTITDLIDARDPADRRRLATYAATGPGTAPMPGFWSERDLTPR